MRLVSKRGYAWLLLAPALLVAALLPGNAAVRADAAAVAPLAGPDEGCGKCHAKIVASYAKTSMARGSGIATDALEPGTFVHASSGVTYTVSRHDNAGWLTATRASERAPLNVTMRLDYFIGSGKHGRTYLFSRLNEVPGGAPERLWSEAPVNWYTRRAAYGMAPAYDNATNAPLALPTDAGCLHCHVSQVARSVGAPNAFAGPPFREAGIGCSDCHGDAAAHVRSGGKTPMLKLAALAPQPRISVCLQCHLEGDAMVQREGRTIASFQPGEELSAVAVYFVNASSPKSALRASSQYEGMLRSACFRATGPAMTCTTCHDPHSTPVAAERVAFFRAKCLACHTAASGFVAATHHAEQPDCAACHMPSRDASDITHEQTVDHDIEARPGVFDPAMLTAPMKAVDLVPVGPVTPTVREQGLAYAQFAERGDRRSYERAVAMLANAEIAGHADRFVHEQLGYLAQIGGKPAEAKTEYEAALQLDATDLTALANLAVLEAQSGDAAAAIEHLAKVSAIDPEQTAALLNLALLECRSGQVAAAKTTVERAQRFNPDNPAARQFLQSGRYAGTSCKLE